jgi:hypothetical protein
MRKILVMPEPERKPEPLDYATFRQHFPRGVEWFPVVVMVLSILFNLYILGWLILWVVSLARS